MDEALAEVQRLADSTDEGTRTKIVNSLRNTIYSIESQDETLRRIMFLVRHKNNSLPSTLRPGSDKMITFHVLASSSRRYPSGHQYEGL